MVTLSTNLFAQGDQINANNEWLKRFAEEAAKRYKKEKKEAIAYARKNNIPVRQVREDGTIIELQKIDQYGHPQYYITGNADAAKSVNANNLYAGGGLGLSLTGNGYSDVGEWDGGKVLNNHQEFGNRVTQGDGASSLSDHATHVAGTIIGAGVKSDAQGMAPDAELTAYNWGNDDSEMASAASNGLEISNHSYGYLRGWYKSNGEWNWGGDESISSTEDYRFGFYSNSSKDWDQIAYNAPHYLIVKSAGNDRGDGPGSDPSTAEQDGGANGYDCIGTRGVAKNLLTVGAAKDVTNYTGPESVDISSFSSFGPADDGRIKPDIVTNGVGLYSSTANNTSSYSSYSGTSMSAPNTTGVLALLQKHYRNTHGGASMNAATMKALITTTANESGSHKGPDYKYGWGLLNAKKAAKVITRDAEGKNVIQEKTLNDGGAFSNNITLGHQTTSITITWTDPAGNPVSAQVDPSDKMLVNDLDIQVEGPNGQIYYPWSLDPNNPYDAATNNGENNADNVEQVFIEDPLPGQYTVTVDHDGSLTKGPQDFSLVIESLESQKKVHFSGYEIDDDNMKSSGDDDGKVEPGERIELPVKLANNTINDLTGVSATISTNNPAITNISDDSENFGDINAGGSAISQFDYDFTVDSNASFKEVEFYMDITDGNTTWQDTFTIKINGPVVYTNHEIDDDNSTSSGNDNSKIDPGETIELPVEITNNTAQDLTSVSATISTNDPDVTNISDDSENYGDLNAGKSAWTNFDYDFTIADNCPEKDIQFTLNISSGSASWSDTFTLHVEGSAIYVDHDIDDDNSTSAGNNNKEVDAGESIELPVQLQNLAASQLNSVDATLSTNDPYITNISDANESYGDIPSMDSAWANHDYDFTVHPNAPDKDVKFTLNITAGSQSWTDTFYIHVNGTDNLAYTDHQIDDDQRVSDGDDDNKVEPGESIELPVQLANFASQDYTGVSAALSTNDPDITNISDANEDYGDIQKGDSAWAKFDYDFTVSPDAPEKDVEFYLDVTTDSGYTFTDTFTIHIHGEIVYTDLEIDDDQSTSNGDDDSKIEPGEEIELLAQLTNENSDDFDNVKATLSSNDSVITNISDDVENYGTINSGDSAWTEFDYDFTVDSAAPQKSVKFTLDISADSFSWKDTFYIQVHNHAVYADHQVDDDNMTSSGDNDGKIEPGEQIELPVQVANTSVDQLSSVSADISTNDPYITNISDDSENYGNIAGSDSSWCGYDYDFTVDSACPDKDVKFALAITSNAGQTWYDTFTVHVHSNQTNKKEDKLTSVDDPQNQELEVKVYPNPSDGQFDIRLSHLKGVEANLFILNASGKQIVSEDLAGKGQSFHQHYDLSDQAAGVYFLKISGSETQHIKRIVIR